MCFGRLRMTHAVVEAAVATMVPRTQAILRALRRRCLSGSRAAMPRVASLYAAAALLQRCCTQQLSAVESAMVQSISADAATA